MDHKTNTPRVLVCGGRNFNDYEFLRDKLDLVFFEREWIFSSPDGNWLPVGTIISGKAKGADTFAIDYAVINLMNFIEFPADWEKYGKKAGYIRNKQMLDEGKPDLVVAFPGGKGTAMMVNLAKQAGVPIVDYR